MKIYTAGYGHPIEKNKDFIKDRAFNFLLTYYDVFKHRFEWVKNENKKKRIT